MTIIKTVAGFHSKQTGQLSIQIWTQAGKMEVNALVLDDDLQEILQQMEQEELDFFNGGTILITGCAGSLALELITFLARHGNVKKIMLIKKNGQ